MRHGVLRVFVSFCVLVCVRAIFVIVPLNLTYLHCLQHSFNLYLNLFGSIDCFRYELWVTSWWHNFGPVYVLCRPMEVLLKHFRQVIYIFSRKQNKLPLVLLQSDRTVRIMNEHRSNSCCLRLRRRHFVGCVTPCTISHNAIEALWSNRPILCATSVWEKSWEVVFFIVDLLVNAKTYLLHSIFDTEVHWFTFKKVFMYTVQMVLTHYRNFCFI